MATRGINMQIIVGNLGRDPEVRYTAGGLCTANITVATTYGYKDKVTGQPIDNTEWHRVVFFGRLAEIVGEHLKKGAQVYIKGRSQTRKWKDAKGEDKWTHEVVAEEMQMLGSRSGGTTTLDSAPMESAGIIYTDQETAGYDSMDDDIPF